MNIFGGERIELGLSITDIVNEINYPISIIESLEKDELNFLPKPYLYYYSRSYGKYLKILDLKNIIAKYK